MDRNIDYYFKVVAIGYSELGVKMVDKLRCSYVHLKKISLSFVGSFVQTDLRRLECVKFQK